MSSSSCSPSRTNRRPAQGSSSRRPRPRPRPAAWNVATAVGADVTGVEAGDKVLFRVISGSSDVRLGGLEVKVLKREDLIARIHGLGTRLGPVYLLATAALIVWIIVCPPPPYRVVMREDLGVAVKLFGSS